MSGSYEGEEKLAHWCDVCERIIEDGEPPHNKETCGGHAVRLLLGKNLYLKKDILSFLNPEQKETILSYSKEMWKDADVKYRMFMDQIDSAVSGFITTSESDPLQCPSCGSSSIHYLNPVDRLILSRLFVTYRCNACGHTW